MNYKKKYSDSRNLIKNRVTLEIKNKLKGGGEWGWIISLLVLSALGIGGVALAWKMVKDAWKSIRATGVYLMTPRMGII